MEVSKEKNRVEYSGAFYGRPFRSLSGFRIHSDKARLIFGGVIVVNALFISIDTDLQNTSVFH